MDLHVTALIVSALVGLLVPLVSTWLTAQHWPPELGGIATIVLSAITGFVAQWVANPDWTLENLYAAAVSAGLALLAAFQARARVWKGGALDEKLASVTPLGRKRPLPYPRDEAA